MLPEVRDEHEASLSILNSVRGLVDDPTDTVRSKAQRFRHQVERQMFLGCDGCGTRVFDRTLGKICFGNAAQNDYFPTGVKCLLCHQADLYAAFNWQI